MWIDARKQDAVERLQQIAPERLDAVLALSGSEVLNQMLDWVRTDGRVAFPNGVEPEPKRSRKYRRIAYDAVNGAREFTRLKRAAEDARLQVPIAAAFPLAQAAKPHRRLEQGHILGRIALRVRDENRGTSARRK